MEGGGGKVREVEWEYVNITFRGIYDAAYVGMYEWECIYAK